MTDVNSPRLTQFEFPANDVVIMRIHSLSAGDDTIIERMRKRAEQGPYFLAADFRQLEGSFDRSIHEEGPKMVDPSWLLGVAYIGAPMPLRILLKVFNLAMFLTGKGHFPYVFVADDVQALAEFARMRSERQVA